MAGHGEDLPSAIESNLRSNQGPRAFRCLDNHHALADAGDDPISCGKAETFRTGSEGVFSDQSATLGDFSEQGEVLPGIDNIQPAAKNGDRATRPGQGAGMGFGVDSKGQTGDYGQ
jgi:hypothetical protein